MRRIVVTGMGMVTPLGRDLEATWSALQEGRSGVGAITLFDAETFPTRIAAEATNFALEDYINDAERWQEYCRNTKFAIAAAQMAIDHSGLETVKDLDRSRFGVYLGSGEGQQDFPRFVELVRNATRQGKVDTTVFTSQGLRQLHPIHEAEQEPGTPSGHLASLFGARGPNANCLTACAASSQAIGEATEIIRRGDADVMLSGGTHSMIHPFGVTGFNLLTALSTRNDDPTRASRPFDRDRDGFILGEGAGMLILEELEHAKKRGATIYGEVAGYGSTADAFRITDSHDEGRGAIACMREALAEARLNPEDVDYINAHGTSTSVNDSVETLAIKRTLGEAAYQVPISSTKSMMGHLIAAAGSVEAIVCLLTIRDGILPPTINLDNPGPDCDLDYIPHVARRKLVDVTFSNSFGFGGQNIALILRRFAG
ncbi:beta-ketoacyl-ACP synthase II [Singulisphaera acidiphila]|uniref:3-oxoacyl-[acyl-carrier-protein] synthase 2 n=1 Tax=Singulisphaera acidiphila (strain ATCC BAA-1392 / DSM 18658 / VKM B-2454 / MOB10) TaxID=886293 RepID=L0DNP5_SINAD|nr:beta-ketoacyl-ACP synthase II [Singulisphaera acidiphila]AGA30311.1 beta-ketoacyl-acyl-carrier-protein synthase II [Singulisphaera acidiphila DSM 18658]